MKTLPITDSVSFGHALREARRARGLRLLDVAFGAGVGMRFISELERGKPTARLGKALCVAEALGVDVVLEDAYERPQA